MSRLKGVVLSVWLHRGSFNISILINTSNLNLWMCRMVLTKAQVDVV